MFSIYGSNKLLQNLHFTDIFIRDLPKNGDL